MTTEQRAHEVLSRMGYVRNISAFGHELFTHGVVSLRCPGKRISQQGAALLAGKWLRRLEAIGLATDSVDGWRAV